MSAKVLRSFLATASLATLAASWGCVADRPSRNGVFNENQYVRKAFLVRAPEKDAQGNPKPDNGWLMKATLVSTSTPNPLAALEIQAGISNEGSLVRFDVTQDKLRMLNLREMGEANAKQASRDPEVVNTWPITNVDLKYRINLDGEKTNFYEENQELDWQVRQWVKLNVSKNDMSDLAPFVAFGFQEIVEQCTDQTNSTVTLVPGSFFVDEKNDYMSWNVNMSFPLRFGDAACVEAYGPAGRAFQKLGRQTINLTLKYSMVRAKPAEQNAYVPFEIGEKDTIRRKYGTLDFTTISRDKDSGLLGARQFVVRHDPNKDIVYYFAPGFPEDKKLFFTEPGGVIDQTNKILEDAHATGRLQVREFDDEKDLPESADGKKHPREYGDVRYHWLRWISDIDTQTSNTLAFTQVWPDPRTGENVSSNVVFFDFELLNLVKARLDFYLESIGALSPNVDPTKPASEWADGPAGCKDGDVIPLVKSDPTDPAKSTLASRNSHSTLYAKMQEYLQKPVGKYGNLSPADFVLQQDKDFFDAYYAILPYELYGDPAANLFVIPEGSDAAHGGVDAMMVRTRKEAEFHGLAADLDKGHAPFDFTPGPNGVRAAAAFADKFKSLLVNHRELGIARKYLLKNRGIHQDSTDMFNYIDVFQRDARHCVGGKWETKKEYLESLTRSYYAQTVWHEMGHALGLDHNFMGSVDRNNFPRYKDRGGRERIGGYSSSLMDYNATPDRVFWSTGESDNSGAPLPTGAKYGWYPYDRAALGFIYANLQKAGEKRGEACAPAGECSFSGQSKPNKPEFAPPYKDPYGVSANNKEVQFLYCGAQHEKYTPLCREHDFGTTPSEIVAAAIDDYEWQYKWRNFRLYRKFWSLGNYIDKPAELIMDMRRFLAQWTYDWSQGEIQDTLRRIGVEPPKGIPAAGYYAQLTNKFNNDISMASMLAGAFHKAVIQQSSGERPFKTVYDNYFGDVTQQGIFIDKLIALESWVDLWTVDNYDLDQSEGAYLASYSDFFGDASYATVGEDVVDSMVGGQYDVFPFARPLAVVMFSRATHDVNFSGRIDARDWIGGKVFYRERDFLDYFRGIAVQRNSYCSDTDSLDTCTYDPREKQFDGNDIRHSNDFNEFVGPDSRRWTWAYVADRNAWIAVDRDRNTASYNIVRAYNNLVIRGEDDSERPFYVQLQVKYFLDAYNEYN